MKTTTANPLLPLLAWAALLVLTLISIALGATSGHASWMPLLMAAIIWIKGSLVARCFIESHLAHPYIAWLLRAFVALVPLALVLTTYLRR